MKAHFMLHKFTNQVTDMLVGSQVAPAQGGDPGRRPQTLSPAQ